MAQELLNQVNSLRDDVLAVASEVSLFSEETLQQRIRVPFPLVGPLKLAHDVAEGFFQRQVSYFSAMLLLTKSGFREQSLVLARTLYELDVDIETFSRLVRESNKLDQVLERVIYAWYCRGHHLLKNSFPDQPELAKQLEQKLQPVESLTAQENNLIKEKKHFSGLDVFRRSEKVDLGKYYKPLYAGLSKYTHGMHFDEVIGQAKGTAYIKLALQQSQEELMSLYYCATMQLASLPRLAGLTGRTVDETMRIALNARLEDFLPRIRAIHEQG